MYGAIIYKYEVRPLPAQHCPLHVWYCLDEPEQVEPPHEGLGLLHDRDLYWLLNVPPHVTGQELHPPYPLHPPCTKSIKIKIPHKFQITIGKSSRQMQN